MVHREKYAQALQALNAVLVMARSMAMNREAHASIADVLDAAEYLPVLLSEPGDQTETFRLTLEELARKYEAFRIALERFDAQEARPESSFVQVASDKMAQRTFRMWDFVVSHSQLLFRSPPSSEGEKNLDIVFAGVEYMSVAAWLVNPRLCPPTVDELREVAARVAPGHTSKQVVVLESEGIRHLVSAVGMRIIENGLELFESSLERFGSKP